uniref:hypothetical protein n=1 Tax=Helicobacter bilis TaxID=37372 RepID=UPI001B33E864
DTQKVKRLFYLVFRVSVFRAFGVKKVLYYSINEIFILLLIVIIFLASKIGFIKILLWLLNKIL